jgi:hypothetical protein
MTVADTRSGEPGSIDALYAGLLPGLIVLDIPADARGAAMALGVQPASFVPMPDGALQAEFRLPERSLWRVSPGTRSAIWIGSGLASSQPPVRWAWRRPQVAIADVVRALAGRDIWLQEGRLLTAGRWGSPLPAIALAAAVSAPDVQGLAGTWTVIDGHAVRGVVFDDGRLWGENAQQTERWLLTIADIV